MSFEFVPSFHAWHYNHAKKYNDQEEIEVVKIGASQLVSTCPVHLKRGIYDELPDEQSRKYFLPGLKEHYWQQLNNENNRFSILTEKLLIIFRLETEKNKMIRVSIIPDSIKLGHSKPYCEEYKTVEYKTFYFQYLNIDEGLPWDNKMQLSLEAFAFFIHHGWLINEGKVVYILREDPLNQIHVHDDLYNLKQVETFLLDHPIFQKTGFDLKSAAYQYQENKSWVCDYCKKQCEFKRSKIKIEKEMITERCRECNNIVKFKKFKQRWYCNTCKKELTDSQICKMFGFS